MNRRQLLALTPALLAPVTCNLEPAFAAPKAKVPFELLDIEGFVRPRGINNNGDISGFLSTDTSGSGGFIHSNGQTTMLNATGAIQTFGWGIDDQQRVVGGTIEANSAQWGFIYENGQYTRLIQGLESFAFGVSEGRVVGYFIDNLGQHGFLWQSGQFTQLDYPGVSGNTLAYGINAAGVVAGRAGGHGFTWQNGVFTEIRHPRLGAVTELYDITSDTILGGVSGSCSFDPFILTRDRFTLLDMPGTYTFGINDNGQIVGDYGQDKGFVANLRAFISKGNRPAPRFSRLLPLGAQ